jgi:energy-coupling factor transporter transmembrane protein EcfT
MAATTEAQNRLMATLLHQPYEASPPDSFYTNATLLVAIAVLLAAVIGALGQLVAISEAIVSRRRGYAGVVAAGVPRSVLARAQLWQSLAVAVPALTLATTAGLLIGRFVTGTSVHAGAGSIQTGDGPVIKIPDVVGAVPVPWANLGLVVGVSVGAVALTVAIGLLFLKASTSVDELRTA